MKKQKRWSLSDWLGEYVLTPRGKEIERENMWNVIEKLWKKVKKLENNYMNKKQDNWTKRMKEKFIGREVDIDFLEEFLEFFKQEIDTAREEGNNLSNDIWFHEDYTRNKIFILKEYKQTLLEKIEEMKEKFQSKTTDYSEGYGNGWASAINKIKKIIKETI